MWRTDEPPKEMFGRDRQSLELWLGRADTSVMNRRGDGAGSNEREWWEVGNELFAGADDAGRGVSGPMGGKKGRRAGIGAMATIGVAVMAFFAGTWFAESGEGTSVGTRSAGRPSSGADHGGGGASDARLGANSTDESVLEEASGGSKGAGASDGTDSLTYGELMAPLSNADGSVSPEQLASGEVDPAGASVGDVACAADLRILQTAVMLYEMNGNGPPTSVADLVGEYIEEPPQFWTFSPTSNGVEYRGLGRCA